MFTTRRILGGGLYVLALWCLVLRAPFPWFGGKSRAASIVWAAFGDTANYVEPFCGSMAVLLARPFPVRIETVNDRDCWIANFWRAIQNDPEGVAEAADWPVNEADLHARHRWLVNQADFIERMKHEPKFFDAKIAGWWVWGICQWIGSGWCSAPEWTGRANAGRRARGVRTADHAQRPDLTGKRGVHSSEHQKRPVLAFSGRGVHVGPEGGAQRRKRDVGNAANWEKRPSLDGQRGIHVREQLPELRGDGGATGSGVHASGLHKKMPDLGGNNGAAGKGVHASAGTRGPIFTWMFQLAERLRRVRVCCGDWKRVLGPSATEKIGITGVLLDPPYSAAANRDPSLYAHDDLEVAHRVREWALANGDNPKLRIALCGYEGEHAMPETWQCVPWKATGGYAASAGNHENAARERIWFSPACLPVEGAPQYELFARAAT